MKKQILIKFLFFSLLFFIPASIFSLDASVSYARFKSENQAYLEVSVQLIGQTVVFEKSADSIHYQARAEIFIRLEQDGAILGFEKYQLNSPLTKTIVDFIDLKRILLPTQDVELIIEIKDVNKEGNNFQFKDYLRNEDFNLQSIQSEIQLFASCKAATQNSVYTKQGFEFEILPYDFYHEGYNQLSFYQELYDTNEKLGGEFYVSALIYQGYAGEGGDMALKKHKRYVSDKVVPILMHIDISDLISGNFHLNIELHRMDHSLVSSQTKNFQRINSKADERIQKRYNKVFEFSFVQKLPEEDLNELLKMHRPLVSAEWASILSKLLDDGNSTSKRHFLYTLWMDEAPDMPEKAFLQYMDLVKNANLMFYNNVGHGYDTDRGHIYLKYGIPDDVLTVEDEPSAPPYEIWKYNFLPKTGQTTVKFLFYNPSLAYNDYHLLHSNCRGEINNPSWEITLYKNAPGERVNGDGLQMLDNFGRNARQNFHDF